MENSGMLTLLSTLSPDPSWSWWSPVSPSTLYRESVSSTRQCLSPGAPQCGVSAGVLRAADGDCVLVQVNTGQVVLETVQLGPLLSVLSHLPLGVDGL